MDWHGHTWQPGKREFLRFSSDPKYREFYLAYARERGGESSLHWAGRPHIEPNAFAWWLTGDEYYLRRLAGEIDWARQATYEGEKEWYRGMNIRRSVSAGPQFTSWYLYQFPLALAAFEAAGGEPALPIPNRFMESGTAGVEPAEDGYRQELPRIAVQKTGDSAIPVELSLSARDGGDASYVLEGPDGEVLKEGRWNAEEVENIEIPADAPQGVYWVRVELVMPSRRTAAIFLPATPPDVPEVIVDSEANFQHMGRDFNQYWFYMPEDIEIFEAEFTLQGGREYHRRPVRRVSLWDGDGKRVWDENVMMDHIETYDESKEVKAEVEVPAGQRGSIWRMTIPGDGVGFRINSPEVRPIFATAPGRWFDPGNTE